MERDNRLQNFLLQLIHTASADCLLAVTRWNSISFPLASSQQNLYDIYLILYVQS